MNELISRRKAVLFVAGAAATFSAGVQAENEPIGFHAETSTESFDWLLPALKHFLGKSTGDYISRDELTALGYDPKLAPDNTLYLYDQFAAFFFSPPDQRIIMPSGNRVLESSWPHYAVRRALVITESNSNRILATALLDSLPLSTMGDEEQRSLYMFVKSGQLRTDAIPNELHQFVQWEVKQEGRMFGQHLVKVESSLKLVVIPLG